MSAARHGAAAWARHVVLTLRLNFRSPAAIAYGFLMPAFFLIAFGSVFRAEQPALWRQMGQILTISVIGGTCLGLPTVLVAERERGVWRRYRLLPVPIGLLVLGTMAARVVIVALAAVLQVVLAHWIFGTPWPLHPAGLAAGFLVVTAAFLGLGLMITALADDVPAVQGLGQTIFLPMILIGGVGVPLAVLPHWAQRVASFLPGRYAVETLQACYSHPDGLGAAAFAQLALAVIGLAAAIVGAKLLRFESGRLALRQAWPWLGAALAAWVVVGAAATVTGRVKPLAATGELTAADITPAQIAAITYADLPGDDDLVTPMALPFADRRVHPKMIEFRERLEQWPPAHTDDTGQNVRNLVALAVIADLGHDTFERQIGRIVYDYLKTHIPRAELEPALAWVALRPEDGTVPTSTAEFGRGGESSEPAVRERSTFFARKCLGKLRGHLAE